MLKTKSKKTILISAIFIVIFSNCGMLSVLQIESRLTQLQHLINNQILTWEKIGDLILNQSTSQSNAATNQPSMNQFRIDLQHLLQSSRQTQSELNRLIDKKTNYLLLYFDDRQAHLISLTSVVPEFLKQVEALSQQPLETLKTGSPALDSDFQKSLISGAYLAPLQQLLKQVRESSIHSLWHAPLILLTLNFMIFSLGFLIWHMLLKPFATRSQSTVQAEITAPANPAGTETPFNVARLPIQEAACLVNKNYQIAEYNEVFNSLFLYQVNTTQTQDIRNILPIGFDNPERYKQPVISSLKNHVFTQKDRTYLLKTERADNENTLILAIDLTELLHLNAETLRAEHLQQMESVIGGIAHDFNNILATIQARVELLQIDNPPPEKLKNTLDILENTCHRASRRVSQMMFYSKRHPLRLDIVSCNRLAEELRNQLHTPDGICLVINNLAHGNILLDLNVFISACEYLLINKIGIMQQPHGQVKFTLQDRICGQESHHYLEILIEDSSRGVSEEALNAVNAPFYSGKKENSGTSLGLAMTTAFIEESNGQIEFKSNETGAEIRLAFPKHQEHLGIPGNPDDSELTSSEQSYCLILEDNLSLNNTLEEWLNINNIKCLCATNLSTAIKIIQENQIPIQYALCDWQLPDGTSHELINHLLQQQPRRPKIVLMTGYDDGTSSDFAEKVKIPLLKKPVKMSTLGDYLFDQSYSAV